MGVRAWPWKAGWRTSGSVAHLDDALTGAGYVGVFLAELAVREHLHVVLPPDSSFRISPDLRIPRFQVPVGLHTGHLMTTHVGREAGSRGNAEQQTASDEQGQCTFMFLTFAVRM